MAGAWRTLTGQPRGLYPLFFTEMWERFNFYIVAFSLVLYLKGPLGFSPAEASDLATWYLALVYFTPYFGGLIADRLLGYSRAILAGGLLMALGNFALAMNSKGDVGHPWLYGGMALLVLGNGLFKPNISALVGKLYVKDDPRRDQGFTIFYMGINIGAFLAPAASSLLWADGPRWANSLLGTNLPPEAGANLAFAAGGVGMLIGWTIYFFNRHQYKPLDDDARAGGAAAALAEDDVDPKADEALRRAQTFNLVALTSGLAGLFLLPLLPWRTWFPGLGGLPNWVTPVTIFAAFWVAIEGATVSRFLKIGDKQSLGAAQLKVVFVVVALFWMAFHQNSVTLTFFAEQKTRPVGPETDPWPVSLLTDPLRYATINALCVIAFSPLIAMLWGALASRGRGPSLTSKMVLGMLITAGAYLVLAGASWSGADVPGNSNNVGPYWLISVYVLLTVAELCLSPVWLSLTSKLAPARYKGLWMGFWFLATAIGNKLIHVVGQYWQTVDPATGRPFPGTYPPSTIFLVLVASSMLAAVALPVLLATVNRRAAAVEAARGEL